MNPKSSLTSPFKFLDAYDKNDREIFFGRDFEIEMLYDTTFKTNMLLVYGQSGTGKTSLLQCGLANRFRETDWFELFIRRRDNINTSLRRKINEKAMTPIPEDASIAEAVQSLYLDYLKPVYLIFDQFEELFILGGKEEQRVFFSTMARLLKGVSCKIIFVMREEYIAWLYEFEKAVPGLFDHRVRVEPMNRSNVESVILGSAKAFEIELASPDDTVGRIIDNNRDPKGAIHLPYLQVYLDRLYREAAGNALEDESRTILFTAQLVEGVGEISDVMATFLEEQTQEVQQRLKSRFPETPADSVWQLLNQFVTLEGTKLPLTKAELLNRISFPEPVVDFCLEHLEKARILHVSEQDNTHEIAHDALARSIEEKRSVEEKTFLKVEKLIKERFAAYQDTSALLTKGELNYIEIYEERLKPKLSPKELLFIRKSKNKVSRRRTLLSLAAAATALIMLFAWVSYIQWRKSVATQWASAALLLAHQDPTKALRLAEAAWKMDANDTIKDALEKIYSDHTFYKIFAKTDTRIQAVDHIKNPYLVLTGSDDGVARLYDMDGQPLAKFSANEKAVLAVAISPDGKTFLTGSEDGYARLWNRKEEILKEYNHIYPVRAVAFLPGGKKFLTGSESDVACLWNGKDEKILELVHQGDVNAVAFCPNTERILTGSADKIARLWDMQGKLLKEFRHEGGIKSVAISENGQRVLTGSVDNTAKLWKADGTLLCTYDGHDSIVRSVAFSPIGDYIATGCYDGVARLWDFEGRLMEMFIGHTDWVNGVVFSGNQRHGIMLTISRDGQILKWSLLRRQVQLFQHRGGVESVAVSSDGQWILTGSKDRTAKLWTQNGKEHRTFTHQGEVESVAFSQDDRYVITGAADDQARVWDLYKNTGSTELDNDDVVESVAFSHDGKLILTGAFNGEVRLWDMEENCIWEYYHRKGVESVTFSPDDNYFLTGSYDRFTRLWQIERDKNLEVLDAKEILSLETKRGNINAVTFSPGGKYILAGSADHTARLWDRRAKELLKLEHFGGVESVAFSHDGEYILTGSKDTFASLWNRQGKKLQAFKHGASVEAAVFMPRTKEQIKKNIIRVLTGSRDNTARIWETLIITLDQFLKDETLCQKFKKSKLKIFGRRK